MRRLGAVLVLAVVLGCGGPPQGTYQTTEPMSTKRFRIQQKKPPPRSGMKGAARPGS